MTNETERLFWLLHCWKLTDNMKSQLDSYMLIRWTAAELCERLAMSENGNLVEGYIPIYQFTSKRLIQQLNPDAGIWLSFRCVDSTKIVLIQVDRKNNDTK